MKFEYTQVFNFEGALRGMRNPLESWNKSDSSAQYGRPDNEWTVQQYQEDGVGFVIGPNDMNLAQRLIKGGPEHRKYLRMISICVDITAPLYWWSEMDTYSVGVTKNSTSTMHKIMSKPFTPDLFECEGMRGYKRVVEQKPNEIDEDTEEWLPYPSYPNYVVSNQGRVKHLSYVNTNGRRMKERIIPGVLHQDGYVVIAVVLGNSRYKQIPKHRIVAETWIPNPLNKPEVNHIDGNKQNNSVENLEWVTSSENQRHAIQQHLQPTTNGATYKGKLSKSQRDEIILRYATEDISRRALAQEYGVSHTTINALISNKYSYGEGYENEFEKFLTVLDTLNELRDEWLITKDAEVWKTLIEILPRNWLQTRTITMNYEVLRNIVHQRKGHKLTEWHKFIDWAHTLPYAEELIFFDGERGGEQNV